LTATLSRDTAMLKTVAGIKLALREALEAVRIEIFRETTQYSISRNKMAIGQYCAVALPLLRLFIER
jgi:hypothetical protein